jgi:toxin ParE1/3/4
MGSYRLARDAEKDLEDIWVYLGAHDDVAADLAVGKILDRLPMLAQFPSMGVARARLMVGLRSFPVRPYVVFYVLIPGGIEILRIIHQSRDVERLFS